MESKWVKSRGGGSRGSEMMGGKELPCVGLKEDESQAFCPLIHPHTPKCGCENTRLRACGP